MVALIAYGSLYPFNLKASDDTFGWWQTLWQALTQLSWARAGHGDRVANVLLYVPLGFCLSLWLDGRLRHRGAVVVATLCGAVLSLSIEVAQVFISSRVPSLWDVTLNTGGALCGAIGGIAWFSLSARLPSTEDGGRGDKVAVIVLALWFASCWAPFSPHFTLSKLKTALQPLFEPQVTVTDMVYYLVWWTLIAQIIFALSSAQRGVEMLLAAIAAVLVGRLFIADLSFVPSELIAMVLLLPTLVILYRLWAPSRRALLLAAFAFVFVFERLTPLASSGSGHFDLWPFIAWRDAGMPVSLHALFKQLFELAALAWLLREAGLSARLIVWSVPLAVLVLEIVALWMPGRDGSPIAPLLALATVLTLRYASDTRRGFTHQRVRSR
jgi:glycopeptide antibiotics resistance protein